MNASEIRVHVHDRDNPMMEGILRLLSDAARPRPLGDTLSLLCQHLAKMFDAQVVSVYVRKSVSGEEDAFVMRANVGFPEDAVGRVRLRLGEGITGFAAECLRPVSAEVAEEQPQYRHVPGLGEERYPAFLAVPLRVGAVAGGVLVLQRRERRFSSAETTLLTALASPFAHVLERSGAVQSGRSRAPAVRLTGAVLAPGRALARAEVLDAFDLERDGAPADASALVSAAFAEVGYELERAFERLAPALEPRVLDRVRGTLLLVEDRRLRNQAVVACGREGLWPGLYGVAREYAAVPARGAESLSTRAAEVEDLCMLVAAKAAGARVPTRGAALLLADRLTTCVTLMAIGRGSAALLLAGPGPKEGPQSALARAAGLPIITHMPTLFSWVMPGARLLVNADRGVVRVNPPATAVAQFRARRAGRPLRGQVDVPGGPRPPEGFGARRGVR